MKRRVLSLLGALVCVLANAFFVAAEFALAKVRPTSLEASARKGDRAAQRALAISHELDAYLSATQLGITFASLALGWLGEPAVEHLVRPVLESFHMSEGAIVGTSASLAFAVISALHIVIGELVPKSLALQETDRVARWSSAPLRFFYLATYPALWVLNGSSRLVLRAMGLPAPSHAEGKLSHEELKLVIDASLEDQPGTNKKDMIDRVLRVTDRPIRTVMIPRVDMQTLSLDDDQATWMAKVRRWGFSRYPVSGDGEPDHVIGYVYVKDLLTLAPGETVRSVGALKRDILIVPVTKSIGDVLHDMQSAEVPIALVVDEYGGTAGLVTQEDVVSEIVGELRDERKSRVEQKVWEEPDGSLMADGMAPASAMVLDGESLATRDPTASTVGGFVMSMLGRLARPGDSVDIGQWSAVVEDVRSQRVHRVRFRRRTSSPR